jgi:hypothetical protein
LIVPVINHSVDVNSPDYLLSTVTIPLAEKGYYVFPVNLVKRVLEDDGLSDADMVHSASTSKLCNLFGADSVLYISIERWDARYAVLSTSVTVELTYTIKESKTGDTIWNHKETMVYTPQTSSSGNPFADLIVMAITAAMTKAAPNYMPLANMANGRAFNIDGTGIPAGPYHDLYKKDSYYSVATSTVKGYHYSPKFPKDRLPGDQRQATGTLTETSDLREAKADGKGYIPG